MRGKRGEVALVLIVVVTTLVLCGTFFLFSDQISSHLTGAAVSPIEGFSAEDFSFSTQITAAAVGSDSGVGAQKMTTCDISLYESVNNIGHDYECDGEDGFIVKADDLTIDCQNHSITCVGNCDDVSGFLLEGVSGVTIQNCKIYNFEDGVKIDKGGLNYVKNSVLENNSDGIDLYNTSANNLTANDFNNNTLCGVNASEMNHLVSNTESYNNIWNNLFYTNDTDVSQAAPEACNDVNSYNYWYLEKNCDQTNIIGGPCLGGNYWSTYSGEDSTGDGLGDSGIPYTDGDILATGIGDRYPLVEVCGLPGVVSEQVSCDENITSETGQGIAIVEDYSSITCDGNWFAGNVSSDDEASKQRGIEIIGVHDVNVTGCELFNWTYGIYIQNSYNIIIENNYLHDNNYSGVYVADLAYNVTIRNNNISNELDGSELGQPYQEKGIEFVSSYPSSSAKENWVLNNTISNHSEVGIHIVSNSDYVEIEENTVENNSIGVLINGSDNARIVNNLIFNNNYIGLYLLDATGVQGFGSYPSSTNNVSNNYIGLQIEDSGLSVPVTGGFEENVIAISLNGTSNPDFGQTVIVGPEDQSPATYGVLFDSTASANIGYLTISNVIYGLFLKDNDEGIKYDDDGSPSDIFNTTYGFYFDNSNNSNLSFVNYELEGLSYVHNNSYGFFLENSHNNTFYGFNIHNNTRGINLSNSDENTIYNNNFSNNAVNAQDDGSNYYNLSKHSISGESNIVEGSYFGGNFWYDYSGSDTTGDNLGDTSLPYNATENITDGNGDFLPLVVSSSLGCSSLGHDSTLSADLEVDGSCYTLSSDGVTLDCSGYRIIGNGTGTGIDLNGKDRVTIKNCTFENFEFGIELAGADNAAISDNKIINSSTEAVLVSSVIGLNFTNNLIENDTGGDLAYGLNLTYVNYSVFDKNNISDNIYGVLGVESYANNFSNNYFINNSFGLVLNGSEENLVHNNYFNNSIENAQDNSSNNFWNSSYSCGAYASAINIIGEDCLGGNFWSDYSGSDDGSASYPNNESYDGVGDTLIPFNSSGNIVDMTSGSAVLYGDYLPLKEVPVLCGDTITSSVSLSQNLLPSVNPLGAKFEESCLIIGADNVTIDLNGFNITGNGTGIGINISNRVGVTVVGDEGIISNFSTGIYADPSSGLNFSNITLEELTIGLELFEVNGSNVEYMQILNNDWGVVLNESYNNTLQINNLTSNLFGLEIESSTGNKIFDNYFDNTNNALDDGSSNEWNTSYSASTSIIGGSSKGGNFWSDYTGKDNGGGSSTPYQTANDGVGDSQIPYNYNITGGDYLPLTSNTGSTSTCQTITEDTILSSDVTCNSGSGIVINVDDVTLDCRGNKITGSGNDAGIEIDGFDGVTIKNCTIENFYYGIKIVDSVGTNVVEGNNITLNDFYGIYLYNANQSLIDDNEIVDDNNGVYQLNSYGTNITNNTIDLHRKFYAVYSHSSDELVSVGNNLDQNYHGVYLVNSDSANVSNNTINGSDKYNVFVHSGSLDAEISENVLSYGEYGVYVKSSSNSVDILDNTVFSNTVTGVFLSSSTEIYSKSNNLTGNVIDFYGIDIDSLVFEDNTISESAVSFELHSSDNSWLDNNTINATSEAGIVINESGGLNFTNNSLFSDFEGWDLSSAIISDNNFTEYANFSNLPTSSFAENYFSLIKLVDSPDVNYSSNDFVQANFSNLSSANIKDNSVDDSSEIVFILEEVSSSTINDNRIENADVAFMMIDSDSNTFYDNWIQDNGEGINLTGSGSNTFYNNYFENTENVVEDEANTWQTSYSCADPNIVGGPCKGGNFYSDYYGLDDGSSSRDEGDGIGDNPSSHTVSSHSSDSYPLVLYVARQYYAPDDATTAAFTATANVTGALSDNQVLPNEAQLISYSDGSVSASPTLMKIVGNFDDEDVDASNLVISYEFANYTLVNFGGSSGFEGNYSVYLSHNKTINGGVYVCPEATSAAEVNESCTDKISVGSFPSSIAGGMYVTAGSEYFILQNVTNSSIGLALESSNVCGANISHDVVLNQNVACDTDPIFSFQSEELVFDCADYSVTGDYSNVGFNLSSQNDVNNVTIKDCVLSNLSKGILLDGTNDSLIANLTINNSHEGVVLNNANNNTLTENTISNSSYGVNLTGSKENSLYDNYFNNTINAFDNDGASNFYNISYLCSNSTNTILNIIGGDCSGGNFWADYAGSDLDLDGIGDSLLVYNSSGQVSSGGGDFLPLVEVGKISCETISENVTLNRNVNSDLGSGESCFNVSSDNVLFDCDGNSITGSGVESAFNVSSSVNFTLKDCVISNFSDAIVLGDSNYSNFSDLTINDSVRGFLMENSNNNTVSGSTIENNSFGLNFSVSVENKIYNNFFNNTEINVIDLDATSYNEYNVSYSCTDSYENIVGGNCSGGNFWADYNGSDNGNGSGAFADLEPWNISGDGIGDTLIPYNASNNVSSGNGDFLPLVKDASSSDEDSGSEGDSGSGGGSSGGSGSGGGSSGGGGGGGSSSSSSSSETSEEVEECKESWTCEDWSECSGDAGEVYGYQSRTCFDQNSCRTYSDRPDETRVCEIGSGSEEGDAGAGAASGEEDLFVEPIVDFVTIPSPARTFTISSIALIFGLGSIFAYWEFMKPTAKLRRRLRKAHSMIGTESVDALKGEYKGIYGLYMKVSEKHKQNFYANVTKVREHIEEQLKAEKEIEKQFENVNSGEEGLLDMKRSYLKIYNSYKKLPAKSQKRYYHRIVNLREYLEKGRMGNDMGHEENN